MPFDRQIPTSAALRVDRRSAVYRAEQEYVMESAKKRTRRSPSGDERKAIAYVDRTHLSEVSTGPDQAQGETLRRQEARGWGHETAACRVS